MKKTLSADDWSWLYWFLGVGAGSEARNATNAERTELVCRRSYELVNKLNELRAELDKIEGDR